MRSRTGRCKWYAAAAGYTLFLYATIPYVREIQRFVYGGFGKSTFTYVVLAGLGGAGAWIVVFLWRLKVKERVVVSRWLWLAGVAGAYLYFTLSLRQAPEEAVHFLEFGLLSFLVYRALSFDIRDATVYLSATLVVFLLGTVDEIIQWLIPERYWDFRDVGLNLLAGGLLQVALWKGILPKEKGGRVALRSVRVLSALLAAGVLLPAICASTTPARVKWLRERIPLLGFLAEPGNMMAEYGFQHHDPGIGWFKSRLSRERLAAVDREKAEEHAGILNDWRGKDYQEFLRLYSPLENPFLYEMRVRLFRRDRYLAEGKKAAGGKKAAAWFVAYRENQILERYFGETMRRSLYRWPEELRSEVEREVSLGRLYESPVSRELFTAFSEKQMWGAVGILLACIAVGNVLAARRWNVV